MELYCGWHDNEKQRVVTCTRPTCPGDMDMECHHRHIFISRDFIWHHLEAIVRLFVWSTLHNSKCLPGRVSEHWPIGLWMVVSILVVEVAPVASINHRMVSNPVHDPLRMHVTSLAEVLLGAIPSEGCSDRCKQPGLGELVLASLVQSGILPHKCRRGGEPWKGQNSRQ